MNRQLSFIFFAILTGLSSTVWPGQDFAPQASLQRGAAFFVNYCAACHSLKYLTYEQMVDDLAIPASLVKANLIFTEAKLHDPMLNALTAQDAQEWFGVSPPDLSLSARQRGETWLYRYLTGFYPDAKAPWGVNNHMLANTAMPNVLERGNVHRSQQELEQDLLDLINFLAYVAEPHAGLRRQLGPYVLLFLVLLFIPIYCLKRLYWSKLG